MDKEDQEVHTQFKRDNEESHTVTARSLSNITVTTCHKTITGYNRPFYIQIVGNEVFLIEYTTQYVHACLRCAYWINTQEVCHSSWTPNRIVCQR